MTLYGHACEFGWLEMPQVVTVISPATGKAVDFNYLYTEYLDDEAFTAMFAGEDMKMIVFYYD
jgi:hypothetical protein